MQLSAFHQDRADRLPEQTQRYVYGGATRAQRHNGGIVKIFHWEGEPQRELDTATTMSFVHSIHLNHGITYLQRRNPLPLIQYNSIYTVQHLHAAKLYFASRRSEFLNLPALYFLYILIHSAHFNTLAMQILKLSIF